LISLLALSFVTQILNLTLPDMLLLLKTMGLALTNFVQAGNATDSLPLKYDVHKTSRPIQVDGKMEKAWKKAPWTSYFQDIEGSKKPVPRLKTRAKMLWDENYLYVLAELEEPHLWATLTKRDAIIFNDHDFEVFLDPNNDQEQYFEYEINALGTVMDLFMTRPYKKGGPMVMGWNSNGLLSAVRLNGTLNDNRDIDKGWIVEMAIPYKDLERPGRISNPISGATWRINFSRVQWTMDPDGQSYKRRIGANGKRLPEDNWVWSPQGLIDMHFPQYWGYITFKDK
jgi:hypothetical protein